MSLGLVPVISCVSKGRPMFSRRSLLQSVSTLTVALVAAAMPVCARPQDSLSDRWSAQKANDWYAKQPWLVGADFIPSNAINEFEMFQAATFDPDLNDEELGMAESIGMNTVRVFLQDQLWQQDSQGFTQRLDTFSVLRPGTTSNRCSCFSILAGSRTHTSVLSTRLSPVFIIPAGCRVPVRPGCRTAQLSLSSKPM
jgi:hypothetical protein